MSLTNKELNRYSRHILLNEVGTVGQNKLKAAKVLVVGAGGLGCPVLQYITAAGVGTIGIIDFDTVEVSNLQRQVLFGNSSIGKNKAEAAKNRLSDLNPLIKINTYPKKLDQKNALDLFSKYDIIIDGSDNFATRYLVNDACIIAKKPLIYGSIYRFEGQVSVFNYNNGPSYRCLFPEPPEADSIPNCSQIGVLGVLPGIIGVYQANEALKLILGIGTSLSGKLMLINALNMQNTIIKVKRSDNEIEKVIADKENFKNNDYELLCNVPQKNKKETEITAKDLLNRIENGETFQFIDVREDYEEPKISELNGLEIPLDDITDKVELIDKTKQVVLYCQSGTRSSYAINILKTEHGFNNLINLEGGIVSWLNNVPENINE